MPKLGSVGGETESAGQERFVFAAESSSYDNVEQ